MAAITAADGGAPVSCRVAKFDIHSSITRLRSGDYAVIVSIAPRSARAADTELEEALVATLRQAEELCIEMIDRALARVLDRGDDVADVNGPRILEEGDE